MTILVCLISKKNGTLVMYNCRTTKKKNQEAPKIGDGSLKTVLQVPLPNLKTPPDLKGLNWQKSIWVKLTALYWYLSILPTRRIGGGRCLFQDLHYMILCIIYL